MLTRANLSPFALLAPLWLGVPAQCRTAPRREGIWAALICLAVLALTVSPWLLRSLRLEGTFTLSTQTGFFLWVGNNPYTFSYYPSESIDRSQRAALEALSPADRAQIGRSPPGAQRLWIGSSRPTGTRIHARAPLADLRRRITQAWGCLRFVAQPSTRLFAQLGARAIVRGCYGTWLVGNVVRSSELARTFDFLCPICFLCRGYRRLFRSH